MESTTTPYRFLLSGGGTGGHIFPAVAIADELKKRFPDAEFLFIGASDKMEMQKVPQAGYKIKGIWISGIERKNMLTNAIFPLKLLSSVKDCYAILKEFRPTAAIGTGGFASGPALWVASRLGIPIFLQEQNSFPGITNKFLAKKAKKIFVAYDRMSKFFPDQKINISGNPVRESVQTISISKEESLEKLELDKSKLTILSVGGSLGSRTLNTAWLNHIQQFIDKPIQLIWQTGSTEYEKIINTFINPNADENYKKILPQIAIKEFIQNMSEAYAAADIIVSRAGAIAISELCIAGKPSVLVPYPFAAEDHQTKNAQNLVEHNAAIMVKDEDFIENAYTILKPLLENETYRNSLADNIKKLAKPNATKSIVDEIIKELKPSNHFRNEY